MDDKLILAVFNYPELYNVTLPNYRSTESRANAWRSISTELGIPSEECKRKWKNMRDRYLKEVRMEIKSKKQGDIVPSRWKYRQLMNFIAPFTGSRSGVADICSNNNDDHDNPDNDSGSAEGETTPSETVKTPQTTMKVPASQPDLKPQVPFGSQLPSISQDAQMAQLAVMAKVPSSPQITSISKTGRKRRLIPESVTPASSQSTPSPTKWLVKDNETSLPTRPRDEDELFLLSFVPALKRLAPQKRCETKIKIQQIMYEAEFNVAQPESKEKQMEPETQD
ncbi:Transcription factor Adf-1 ADH distal factor 1 [Channa argus]|uniref:Transcription factor Adf-1 ADH distal factor 1 n=1 Tax=Channa argus TaxID=215402 RepID=A0A6G1QI43_CHAAH|nr:Transcription factor Adf-1 ADH distal factor 1 [Channa argus]